MVAALHGHLIKGLGFGPQLEGNRTPLTAPYPHSTCTLTAKPGLGPSGHVRKDHCQSHQEGGRIAVTRSTHMDHNDCMRSWNVEAEMKVAPKSQSRRRVGILSTGLPGAIPFSLMPPGSSYLSPTEVGSHSCMSNSHQSPLSPGPAGMEG